MNILVTGGAGVVGSHLIDVLLHDDNHVTCLDNLSTGRMENISHLINNERFQLVRQDVCGIAMYWQQFTDRFDAIFHLASPASPDDYHRMPIETMMAGSLGTQRILDLARVMSSVVVFASTSEVYGDPLVHPQVESYLGNVNCTGRRAVYDEAKRFAEALLMAYHREFCLDVRIARLFNTYGPRMRKHDGRVVSNFIIQALCGDPLTIYGDGSQTRSLCYVSDTVRGLVALLQAESVPGPVNIGNPEEVTVAELAERVKILTDSRSVIKLCPLPEDDPKVRKPDITRAKKVLGWEPLISIECGLQQTIEYFRKYGAE